MAEDSKSCPMKKIIESAEDAYDNMAEGVANPLSKLVELFSTDPDAGIGEIYNEYEKRRKGDYGEMDAYVNSVGGPNEGIVAPIYNAVGKFYPGLTNQQKVGALAEVMGIMDRERYDVVQNTHTAYIREPTLLADVSIIEPLYWPGIDEGRDVVQKYKTFGDLKDSIMRPDGTFDPRSVKSDFVVGYSLLRSDISGFGEDYTKAANKAFLYRALQSIVDLRFFFNKSPIDEGTKRLKELLPKSLYGNIDASIEKMDKSYLRPLKRR